MRIAGVGRGEKVTIFINGRETVAYTGETVHAALLASGCLMLRRSGKGGVPRGIFCGMGVCYDCLVTIDGRPDRRACMARVRDGMEIELDE